MLASIERCLIPLALSSSHWIYPANVPPHRHGLTSKPRGRTTDMLTLTAERVRRATKTLSLTAASFRTFCWKYAASFAD